jgi:type IV pilus assembly protein PilB
MNSSTGAGQPARLPLGRILCEDGAIDVRQLEHALDRQRALGLPLGQTLLRLHYLSDDALQRALARQFGVAWVDLDALPIDRALARVISRRYARRHALVPMWLTDGVLTVAVENPGAREVVDELGRLTGTSIDVVTAPAAAIQRASRRLYDGESQPGETISSSPPPAAGGSDDAASAARAREPDEAGGRRGDDLFRDVLRLALDQGASDVHLETLPSGLSLRLRVDGVLRRPSVGALQEALDRHAREVVSRVKILAALDIAERRRPQDGSFQLRLERERAIALVDLRVSVVPSHSGESVVVRLLDRSRAPRALADLDLSPAVAGGLEAALRRTTGIFLVTGPTGSGKSTTLYACLMRLHRPEIRILTAEDPVEYVYDGLSQSEVNPDIGNTFAAYLRAFLRHDPEVIMVGEIRDQDTAEMAFRAAQTGHLLLSTLHTNAAIAAVPRLLDLGIDASLIATSLVGVLSQRLARRICSTCLAPAARSGVAVEELFGEPPPGLRLFRGTGCASCAFTGYRGRLLVADLWMPDEQDLMLVAARAPLDEITRSARRTTISMADDAHARLQAGLTTVEELMRVLPYPAIVEHRARFGRGPGAAGSRAAEG